MYFIVNKFKSPNQFLAEKQLINFEKPIALMLIDSLMKDPMSRRQGPALKYFLEHGNYYPELISSYPTMSLQLIVQF